MEEATSYPPIEPSNFDLIVIGTGLPESILASAASAVGKTVLHLDPNPFYGTHYASLPLNDLISFLQSQSQSQSQTLTDGYTSSSSSIPLMTCPMYFALEVNSYFSEPNIDDNSRKFNLDLAGPRVFLCSDSMIDLILKTGINQYMEFKSVDSSFVSDAQGKLRSVPDSRSAIFKDGTLSLPEKNQLMKFFKLVQGHFGNDNDEDKISQQDLESPFVEFLSKMGLSHKLKSIILYAIALADYDQDNLEVCKDVINTKSGINRLALYHSSIGRSVLVFVFQFGPVHQLYVCNAIQEGYRFPNANGAIIYPIYGQGELPQAFCRRAAVKGCIYVLRMPIVSVLMDKDGGTYKGVKLVSGQELFSPDLIIAPSFVIPSPLAPSAAQVASSHDVSLTDARRMVARGICITKNSMKTEVANNLVFFPPKSLYPEQITSVRVLQLSSNVAACPSGIFVTYLSAMCDNEVEGKKSLNSAIKALFSVPISGNSENCATDSLHTQAKPSLLWSALYMQELTKFHGAFDSISYTPMPDEHLHYNHLLDATEKLFKEIYPNEEFFPMASGASDEHVDDNGSELDS
ncbi:hypothetical protein BUALT_Bualt19G0035300 [Buddleja alternifolia]|uniref:Rab escort protein 1 n=1 Tax=Buddleja alternifolia TaxID=168488 RepID=A0AAV6W1L7_9LAMI|nr:hypothetical protein BUALT_Bualt19G0035300 [Buddleja alternifolia]